MYRHFKLWIWWNFIIQKNEFHKSLNTNLSKYLKAKSNDSLEYQQVLVFKRNIAHELDNGSKIRDISTDMIKRAKI